jgi:beta-galactosidase/beta-glucuronidase
VNEPDDNHPRPQLRRSRWTDLGGEWGFAFDDADVGIPERWHERSDPFDRRILVPYPPESKASGLGDTRPHPVVWYRRTLRIPSEDRGRRLLLHFGAVDYAARVWVNGHLVATHEGGHTSFSADVTEAVADGDAEQVIVVRAEDSPTDLTQPRGKQYWEDEPRRIWYHRTTGIWQPVWFESVDRANHIAGIRWTPQIDSGSLGLQVTLDRVPVQPLRLRVRLTLRDDLLADEAYTVQRREISRGITLEPAIANVGRRQLLWAPAHPNLVDAVITLETDDGTTLDVVTSYAGLRSTEFADGRFKLNGVPTYLRLVLSQGYWPDSLLAAPDADGLRREVEAIKALGFNGVRIHQKVEDPRFLYWCDRLGLLVWGEMANAYAFSARAVERLLREWMEVVRRDVSHPSIVTWVPLNESWGVPSLARDPAQRDYVRAAYHLTKALDPTRPVIGNDGWENLAADAWGIHDYAVDPDVLLERYGSVAAIEQTLAGLQPQHHAIALDGQPHRGEPLILSECGGLNYHPDPSRTRFGYGVADSAEDLLERYDKLIGAIQESPGLAGYCYTQLTDTEQETNGLLFADRTPKLDVAAVAAINTRPSRAIPGDFVVATQAATEVTTFGHGAG